MIDLNEEIDVSKISSFRTILREGFAFKSITHPLNILDAIVIRSIPAPTPQHELGGISTKTLEEHIDFINANKIEKISINSESIDFITKCPSLKYFSITPTDNSDNNFDYSPLYDMPQVKSLGCSTRYGKREELSTSIDCSKLKGLESLFVNGNGFKNFEQIHTLKSLKFFYYDIYDLSDAFCSTILDTLSITKGKFSSLNGIEKSEKLQCLYLYYNHSLQDISALAKVKKSLKALHIENSSKISDFSVLGELENLEHLFLIGSNELPNLDFLKTMKNLKTFVFSMNVQNGDLSPCLNLSYVYCQKNRKHYNLKDKELPKGKYYRGNESIDEWRRLM